MTKRLKISGEDARYLLVFMSIAIVISSGAAYVTLHPLPTGQFYVMYILGSNGLAEHYYPNDNPRLTVGEPVNWTMGIYNHMGGLEYVVVQVKLLNSSLPSPDDLTGTPSPVEPIFEFARVLVDNETWAVPFVWSLVNVTSDSSGVQITSLAINQIILKGSLGRALSGINFRLVFELWFYDRATNGLVFSWTSENAQHSVWTQMWFNVTSTVTK
jgi:hypothetical protein